VSRDIVLPINKNDELRVWDFGDLLPIFEDNSTKPLRNLTRRTLEGREEVAEA
jgi:hypothetical protein